VLPPDRGQPKRERIQVGWSAARAPLGCWRVKRTPPGSARFSDFAAQSSAAAKAAALGLLFLSHQRPLASLLDVMYAL
jgi:hypothetical protein